MVLCQVSLTCQPDIYSQTYPGQMYPLVEASVGQEQYYIRSDLHFFPDFMFSSCRGKSYIGIFIGDMSSWTFRNLCRLICFCCCCYSWMLLLLLLFICYCGSTTTAEQEQQQNYKVTTILIQTIRLNNLCRLICLLLLLLSNCVVATTTTKWYIKHNKNKNKKINLHPFSVQL